MVSARATAPASFTPVPNAVIQFQPHLTLSNGAFRLYSTLLSYAWGKKDWCCPSQARVARDMSACVRSVRTWLRELQGVGLVQVQRRGLTRTNYYTLARVPQEQLSQLHPPQPAADHLDTTRLRPANSAVPERQTLPPKQTKEKTDKSPATHRVEKQPLSFLEGEERDLSKDSHPETQTGKALIQHQHAPVPPQHASTEIPEAAVRRQPLLPRQEFPTQQGTGLRQPAVTLKLPCSSRGKPTPTPHVKMLLAQFSGELHDPDHMPSNTTQAMRLWERAGVTEEEFLTALYTARERTQTRGNILKLSQDGISRNRMPYFFQVLKDVLGLTPPPKNRPLRSSEALIPAQEPEDEQSPHLTRNTSAKRLIMPAPVASALAQRPHQLLWQRVLQRVQEQMTASNFRAFLQDTQLLSWDGQVATIAAPSQFEVDWLQLRFAPLLERLLGHEVGKTGVATRYVVAT